MCNALYCIYSYIAKSDMYLNSWHKALLRFNSNNGYADGLHCYAMPTLVL